MTAAGEITLNYVLPDARFSGASKAMLKALEVRACQLGNFNCHLDSTTTARRFYLSAGYSEGESNKEMFGTLTYAMSQRTRH